MLEDKLKKCPQCSKNKLVRLIGAGSGIIFKGSGFYETDYKRKKSPESAQKQDSKGAADKTAEPKTDEKASSGVKKDKQKTDKTK